MIGFQKIKKFLFIAFGGAFLLVVIGIILSFVFEDEIKTFALQKIGENVTTEINVEEVNFSLFKKFPSASLQFENVLIKETFEEKDTLLFAKNVFLEFNVFDIIKKKYDVKTVSIDRGVTKLKWKKNKEDNYHFWKKTESSSSAFSFSIEKIILENSYVEIDYLPSDFYLESAVDQMVASGKFDDKNTQISSSIDLVLNNLRKGNVVYSDHYHLEGNVETNIAQNGTVSLNNSEIDVDDIPLKIEGVVENNKSINLDLKISSLGFDIAQLIKHLPPSVNKSLSNYRTTGKGTFTCIVKGESSEKNNPDVLINYEVEGGSFNQVASSTEIDNINAAGKFTLLNGQAEKLTLTYLKASLEGNNFKINGWVENFSSPKFDFTTKGHLSLEDVKNFANLKELDDFTGILDLNTRFEGKLNSLTDIKAADLKKINIKGAANIHETFVVIKDSPRSFENIEARLIFNNLKTDIAFINGTIEDSDFHLDGSLTNILPYLFFDKEKLKVTANFASKNLNFNKLISDNNTDSSVEEYHFVFPEEIDFDLKANVGHFEFRKFVADKLKGTAHLKNKAFSIDPVNFATSKGRCNGNLTAKADSKDNIHLTCVLKVDAIDINQLFYEFEDFGQELIVQENIKGIATANIHFSSLINSSLEFNEDQINSTIDITINNGELIELSAMSEISEYISTNRLLSKLVNEQELDKKLRHINFSKLSNTIIVADNQIRIPSMDIYSSAMDITVAGTHSFDNKLDYSLGFRIRDILSSNNESEFGDIQDDGLSNSFFLSMKGSSDHLTFGYDNLAHKEKRQADFREEKKNFKELIKKEVRGENNSSTKTTDSKNTKISVDGVSTSTIKKKKWFEKDGKNESNSEETKPKIKEEEDF